MDNDIRLPLPKKRIAFLRRTPRRLSRVESCPMDRAHITDEHRRKIIEAVADCAATNTARPVLIQLARIFIGDDALRREGLL
jgi:hypothetical protein